MIDDSKRFGHVADRLNALRAAKLSRKLVEKERAAVCDVCSKKVHPAQLHIDGEVRRCFDCKSMMVYGAVLTDEEFEALPKKERQRWYNQQERGRENDHN